MRGFHLTSTLFGVISTLLLSLLSHADSTVPRALHHGGNSSLHTREISMFDTKALAVDDPYTCDADRPCSNSACCGKSGSCGYGPDYCGDGCQSNCDATAECGEFAAEPGKECPLKVCCSQYGFCGTTELFCDDKCQSNCGKPDVPGGGSSVPVRENKVIGYYESWATRRPCHKFPPQLIPISGLTHINFAFAFIEPGTYEVVPMDGQTPASLFKEVTALKDDAPGDLEVFIAIGGWTFSDNGTETQPLFGEISADAGKRQQFADNLVDFMVKYGFDGVDLDWEYPGAPDRGGQERDIENFVLLMKTLRETFDRSARGGYGLTFTIPSSYWYLQYFDVPALLEYADWTNIMSYDLHGVWDENNEIGSIIHGHTNLTEIKLAADLLWRNNVPPAKVVLGMGLYGRSFELENPECAEPKCPFSGPARAGECTGEGGILGYFEIQEILRGDSSIEVIHDEETAVNYFTWDTNQWISYDDRTTFEQKVEWADDVGLGGIMIWAVDMDDDSLTALSGLLGKEVGENIDFGGIGQIGLVIDDWASQNGQNCVMMSCGEKCEDGAIEVGTAEENCDNEEHRKICCWNSNVPSNCQWRGGDTGLSCNGQCRPGELGLFRSDYGDKECLYGEQQFCCTSDRYEDLVGSCETTACGVSECPSGKRKISSYHDYYSGDCEGPSPDKLLRTVCCDEDGELDDCRWTKCHDYQCSPHEVLVKKTKISNIFCRGDDLESRLCCSLKDVGAFLPVPPDHIFPEVPPDDYDYEAHERPLADYGDDAYTSHQSFGMVVIAGPPDVVSNLDKRDGSHIRFLSCDDVDDIGLQTARMVCMNDGKDSNCDDLHLNGLEGTIVKMPENCGPGQYAVARALQVSSNQSIPHHILRKRDSSRPVMDLVFDYDFERVKRADEKIYVRVDYSNAFEYRLDIVADEPVRKRSMETPLSPRFFSPDPEEWRKRFEKLTEVDDNDLYYNEFPKEIDQSLYGREQTCDGSDQFLKLDVEGDTAARVKYGFSMVGTLDPWTIDESYGFLGVGFDVDLSLSCKANTGIDAGRILEELWQVPIRLQRFYQPGVVSIFPQFRVRTSVEATDVGLVADFTTRLRGGTEDYLWTYFPEEAGDRGGQTKSKTSSDAFDGDYKITKGSLTFMFEPRVDFDIQLGKYHETHDEYASRKREWGAESTLASTQISTWMEMGLKLDGYKALYEQSEGYTQVMNGGVYDLFPDMDESQYLIGDRPDAIHLTGPTRDLDAPEKPDFSGYAIFGGHNLLECADGLGEDIGETPEAVCVPNIAQSDPSLLADGEEPSMPGTELGTIIDDDSLDKRGNPRPYDVVDITGTVLFTIWCLAYPSVGRLPWNPGDPMMDISDPDSCTEIGVTDQGDPNQNYVTEHVFELQSIANFISFAIHGRLPDGTQTQHSRISQNVAQQLNNDYQNWAGANPPAENAVWHMFNAIGSNNNKGAMLRTEEQLNAVKGRLWSGNNIIADDTWDAQDLDNSNNIHMALSWLRESAHIFAYMEHSDVQDRLQETVNSIRDELERFQDLYNANHANQIDILSLWDEWIVAYFTDMRDRAASWVRRRGATLRADWQDIVRSRRRDYNANPTPTTQLELEAAEENLQTIQETIDEITNTIQNTSFWNWLP